MADKFRKVSCLDVYGRKRGRVGVKQCMHSFHSLDCLLSVFFDDYMSKLFPIFYLANFVCFYLIFVFINKQSKEWKECMHCLTPTRPRFRP